MRKIESKELLNMPETKLEKLEFFQLKKNANKMVVNNVQNLGPLAIRVETNIGKFNFSKDKELVINEEV